MSGGGSSGTTYQQSQSESGPPAFLQPFLQRGIDDLVGYYNAHPTAPAYYGGETVAPLSTQSQAAVDLASALAGNNPMLAAANGTLGRFLDGSHLDPRTDPDYQAALAASFQPAIDAFNSQILPGLNSSWSLAGRYGSGGRADAIDRATRTLDDSLADAAATAGARYYTDALGQQLQAAESVPALNAARWQDVAGLAAAGRTVDRQRQAEDAAAQAAYDYNANAQMDYIARYLAMLNAGYPGRTTSGSGFANSTTVRSADPFSRILGGAGALTGLLGLF
jgi:hypothetical protein